MIMNDNKMNNRRLNNIMNNLFDLLILSVKIGVSWLMDKWIEVKSVYFVGKETIEEVNTVVELDGIWNGGTTISKSNKENTDGVILNGVEDVPSISPKSPNDNGVIYDGVYDDVR